MKDYTKVLAGVLSTSKANATLVEHRLWQGIFFLRKPTKFLWKSGSFMETEGVLNCAKCCCDISLVGCSLNWGFIAQMRALGETIASTGIPVLAETWAMRHGIQPKYLQEDEGLAAERALQANSDRLGARARPYLAAKGPTDPGTHNT